MTLKEQTMSGKENDRTTSPSAGVGMAAVLALAVLVGTAFNSANPLGVRATATASPARPTPKASATAVGTKALYENETAGLSLETEGITPTSATALPVPIRNVTDLSWPETKKLLDAGQVVLVDARAAVYFQTEHIPGAISLPAGSAPTEVSAFAAKYSKNTALVVYCGSLQCPLSNQLVALLRGEQGYTNVREMPGGFAEYRQSEAQAVKGAAK